MLSNAPKISPALLSTITLVLIIITLASIVLSTFFKSYTLPLWLPGYICVTLLGIIFIRGGKAGNALGLLGIYAIYTSSIANILGKEGWVGLALGGIGLSFIVLVLVFTVLEMQNNKS
jgi:hypothetical protein